MSCFLALALIVTDPAPLLGGPEDARVHTRVVQEHRESAYAYQASSYGRQARAVTATDHAGDRVKAGDPIRLQAGFFYGPLTGGVEQAAPRIIVVRTHHRHHWTERRSY
ncbi:hypothetical protein ABWI01_08100 [Oceanicaulis alexandrii]|uniref:hypothetical protein n=1 Tax=Oceanicaulis alexandrii TaxID=153233 RepID=UPI0035D0518C